MTATTPTTALVAIQPLFTESERLALAGFLAGYREVAPQLPRSGAGPDLDPASEFAWQRPRE